MSRRNARENLFKLVYESCVNRERGDLTLNFILEQSEEKEYIERVYNGIEKKFDFLQSVIADYANDFKADRIYKIDFAIMLVAVYEIFYEDDIPFQVSINEAMELSKAYSTEKSYSFINGILAGIYKDKEKILKDECKDN